MPKRATWQGPGLAAIAEQAGVSISTVDRVMNGRPNVSPRKVQAVLDACQRLGITAPGSPAKPAASPSAPASHLRILLASDSGDTLNQRLAAAIGLFNARSTQAHIDAHFQLTSDFEPLHFAGLIEQGCASHDGIILNCRDDPHIRRAINHAQGKGIPVICMTTDVPQSSRAAYVGMNQFSAGATAAYLMGRFSKAIEGSVILVASASYVCQEQRESGFRRVLRAEFPTFQVLESISSLDDPESAYRNMRHLLRAMPAPVGVYNTAGGNPGIARALSEAGLTTKTVFVGHEGSESSVRLLEAGEMDAVLAHDIDSEIERSVAILAALRAGEAPDERDLRMRRPGILTRHTHE